MTLKLWSLVFGASVCVLWPGRPMLFAAPVQARCADQFVNFIGVNTHLGYGDTIYREYEETIKPRLLELGVRHIRDGTFSEDVARKYLDLGSHGIRVLLITDSNKVSRDAAKILPVLWAVEGINEPDLRPNWVEWTRNEQKTLHTRVKSNSVLKGLPVLVSSLANIRDNPQKLGNLEAFLDYGNMHPYAAGQSPSRHWGWGTTMEQAIAEAQKVSGGKPIVVTECGYHNRIAEEGHPGCNETAAGKYMPRLLLVYFNRGMERAYIYEFADEKPDPEYKDKEQHFGLIRRDGSPKPAFLAVKNLIALLKDPGPKFEPGTLGFTISTAAKDVHRTLLQKRDGRFYLLLWREADSWDARKRQPQNVPAEEVVIRWDKPPAELVSYAPSTSGLAMEKSAAGQETRLQVADEVLVLEMVP